MKFAIKPKKIAGEIDAISSKSHGHRILICAALADKPTKIILEKSSVDIDTTISCLEQLGSKIERDGVNIVVNPIKKSNTTPLLNCMESGSTFRFMVPIGAAIYKKIDFVGEGRLPERPMSELIETMENNGSHFTNKKLPFTVNNGLKGGKFILPGDVSSQYISGILFAAPILNEDVEIELTTKLESEAYVEMTIDAMKEFGINVERTNNGYFIKGGQKYISSGDITVEGDWSNAAFFLVAGAIGKKITVKKLNMNSTQGDKEIVNILKKFGAKVTIENNCITVEPSNLTGANIDISEIPDSLPILSILASCSKGESNFINAKRLRLKESDRLFTTRKMLENLGGKAIESLDSLKVIGVDHLKGGNTDSFNDHRLAMASTIASICSKGEIILNDPMAVNKSYPKFYDDFKFLGGEVNVI